MKKDVISKLPLLKQTLNMAVERITHRPNPIYHSTYTGWSATR